MSDDAEVAPASDLPRETPFESAEHETDAAIDRPPAPTFLTLQPQAALFVPPLDLSFGVRVTEFRNFL